MASKVSSSFEALDTWGYLSLLWDVVAVLGTGFLGGSTWVDVVAVLWDGNGSTFSWLVDPGRARCRRRLHLQPPAPAPARLDLNPRHDLTLVLIPWVSSNLADSWAIGSHCIALRVVSAFNYWSPSFSLLVIVDNASKGKMFPVQQEVAKMAE